MLWQKIKMQRENGDWVDAQSPIIISASRSTDIPAFYSDWFFHRLKVGYSAWTNPFNGERYYVSYADTRFIVFWSKNPEPLLSHLDELRQRDIGCYIQFTLNDNEAEGLENGVPDLGKRIDTFKRLVDKLGFGRVIWRFDPLVLTDRIDTASLLGKIEKIGDSLKGYTEKLVFSFADIAAYNKVKSNLERNAIHYQEWTDWQMEDFALGLSRLNSRWNYRLATCGEKIDIEKYGIAHNKCVDDDLMIRFAHQDGRLMDFLGVEIREVQNTLFGAEPMPANAIMLDAGHYAIKTKNNRDRGQRAVCGCIVSKDIGEYNTCIHHCEYCYANSCKEIADANFKRHLTDKYGETITGR